MGNAARKARKAAGEKFVRVEKTPTVVYITKNEKRSYRLKAQEVAATLNEKRRSSRSASKEGK